MRIIYIYRRIYLYLICVYIYIMYVVLCSYVYHKENKRSYLLVARFEFGAPVDPDSHDVEEPGDYTN